MSLSFVFNVEKLQHSQIHHAKIHNLRLKPCKSQLPKEAWLLEEGRHYFVEWDADRVELAHKLSKRKDAVELVSMVIQFGDQTDWRETPTEGNQYGKALPPPADLFAAGRAIRRWAAQEFGAENVVSLELHTDESTPHFHLLCTPIHEGKLQAKHWLNGAASVAGLRKRAHSALTNVVDCSYVPGRAGGLPHDPSLAAGATPSRADLQSAKRREKQAKQAADKARISRNENESLRAELLATKIVAQRNQDEANAKYQKLYDDTVTAMAQMMERERDALEKAASLEVQVSDLTARLDAATAITSLLSQQEREQILDRPAAALRQHLVLMIERMEADRAGGILTDTVVAKHMLSRDVYERAYREYFPFGNEITQMMDAQKRAQSAPSASQQINPHQTLENAPKRDPEASSYGF